MQFKSLKIMVIILVKWVTAFDWSLVFKVLLRILVCTKFVSSNKSLLAQDTNKIGIRRAFQRLIFINDWRTSTEVL